MTGKRFIFVLLLGAAFLAAPGLHVPSHAAESDFEAYIGEGPAQFDTADAAIAAFRETMAKGDLTAISKLLGLAPEKVSAAEGIAGTVEQVRGLAAEQLKVEDGEDQKVLDLGRQLWPFPFPVVKGEDGKWGFDTVAGLEEIINRRIGENELQAIDTARLYVQAQQDYAAEDRDGDGVLEYAQKLISSEGKTDGLYWPAEQGDGESPVGPNLDTAALEKAKAGDGYFGYKFRILKRQGANVAGGAYDYDINGNMIGGYALIAWPAKYAKTGVSTFIVNQAGVVYERDLGTGTETVVEKIRSFNPDASWALVDD